MALGMKDRPAWFSDEFKQDEYRIVGDQIKKIVTIQVLEYELDSFDGYHNIETPLKDFLASEEGQWLADHWVEMPTYIRTFATIKYSELAKIYVRLFEQDAVYYLLKWK
jgi:hypothetical protein